MGIALFYLLPLLLCFDFKGLGHSPNPLITLDFTKMEVYLLKVICFKSG